MISPSGDADGFQSGKAGYDEPDSGVKVEEKTETVTVKSPVNVRLTRQARPRSWEFSRAAPLLRGPVSATTDGIGSSMKGRQGMCGEIISLTEHNETDREESCSSPVCFLLFFIFCK